MYYNLAMVNPAMIEREPVFATWSAFAHLNGKFRFRRIFILELPKQEKEEYESPLGKAFGKV